jgi:hypothetical protein
MGALRPTQTSREVTTLRAAYRFFGDAAVLYKRQHKLQSTRYRRRCGDALARRLPERGVDSGIHVTG